MAWENKSGQLEPSVPDQPVPSPTLKHPEKRNTRLGNFLAVRMLSRAPGPNLRRLLHWAEASVSLSSAWLKDLEHFFKAKLSGWL